MPMMECHMSSVPNLRDSKTPGGKYCNFKPPKKGLKSFPSHPAPARGFANHILLLEGTDEACPVLEPTLIWIRKSPLQRL